MQEHFKPRVEILNIAILVANCEQKVISLLFDNLVIIRVANGAWFSKRVRNSATTINRTTSLYSAPATAPDTRPAFRLLPWIMIHESWWQTRGLFQTTAFVKSHLPDVNRTVRTFMLFFSFGLMNYRARAWYEQADALHRPQVQMRMRSLWSYSVNTEESA